MSIWKENETREEIMRKLPEGKVIPCHNEHGHFYEVKEFVGSPNKGPVYASVTGKLQILKDEGLINYKMNRAIDYFRNFIFQNSKKFGTMKEEELMIEIDNACELSSRVSQDILVDAGDIGTRIHDLREKVFNEWIKTGKRPDDFISFIPREEEDIRTISGMRALQKFCIERDYIPVISELYVYNHEYEIAGALDDIGYIRKELKEGINPNCNHCSLDLEGKESSTIMKTMSGKFECLQCGYQYTYELCLLDVKTSNQLKDHYFFQVAMYGWMFREITKLKPSRYFILKLSKEDGRYKIEDLKKPTILSRYARHMLKTNEGVQFIKSLRKDNQKVVAPLMQL